MSPLSFLPSFLPSFLIDFFLVELIYIYNKIYIFYLRCGPLYKAWEITEVHLPLSLGR